MGEEELKRELIINIVRSLDKEIGNIENGTVSHYDLSNLVGQQAVRNLDQKYPQLWVNLENWFDEELDKWVFHYLLRYA